MGERKAMEPNDGVIASGTTVSYWQGTTKPLLFEPLAKDESCDVAIVGGGIAGLSVAYMLMREGKDVVLVDDGAIGSGETGRTTAHFTNALDDRYYTLERHHGEEGAQRAAASHSAAIEAASDIVRSERIQCGMERLNGYLFLHPSDKVATLDKEAAACKRAGLVVERVDTAPGFDSGPALMFPGQMQLHPMLYLAGLAKAVQKGGGRIYTQTHGRKFKPGGFEANERKVKASRVVMATNSPVHTRLSMHTKQAAYRTYVIAARLAKGALPRALWWDTGDQRARTAFPPYHYIRIHEEEDHDVLILGGEDHKTGQPVRAVPDPFAVLESWMRKHFSAGLVSHRWSGQVFEPADGLAFLGRDPTARGGFIATGDSGNGMTHGTLAGLLAADLVAGRANQWSALYDPTRKVLGGLATMAREGINATAKYSDYLRPGDVHSDADLLPGQGAVVDTVHPRAVYRDDAGVLNSCSAVCPHLGCLVRWNGVEKSFDCPCHGSRFSALGKVLTGPSNADLAPIGGRPDERSGAKQAKRTARTKKRTDRSAERTKRSDERKARRTSKRPSRTTRRSRRLKAKPSTTSTAALKESPKRATPTQEQRTP